MNGDYFTTAFIKSLSFMQRKKLHHQFRSKPSDCEYMVYIDGHLHPADAVKESASKLDLYYMDMSITV